MTTIPAEPPGCSSSSCLRSVRRCRRLRNSVDRPPRPRRPTLLRRCSPMPRQSGQKDKPTKPSASTTGSWRTIPRRVGGAFGVGVCPLDGGTRGMGVCDATDAGRVPRVPGNTGSRAGLRAKHDPASPSTAAGPASVSVGANGCQRQFIVATGGRRCHGFEGPGVYRDAPVPGALQRNGRSRENGARQRAPSSRDAR